MEKKLSSLLLVGSEDAGGDERFLGGVELWLGREGLGTTMIFFFFISLMLINK